MLTTVSPGRLNEYIPTLLLLDIFDVMFSEPLEHAFEASTANPGFACVFDAIFPRMILDSY